MTAAETEMDIVDAMCIWATNSFPAGRDAGGIFMTAARMNHSCIANVSHTFNEALGTLTVHAARDIKAGEEFEISYIDGACRTREQRQIELKENYGFVCACPACKDTDFGRASEKRRQKLSRIHQGINESRSPRKVSVSVTSPASCAVGLITIHDLMQEEGICSRELAKV